MIAACEQAMTWPDTIALLGSFLIIFGLLGFLFWLGTR